MNDGDVTTPDFLTEELDLGFLSDNENPDPLELLDAMTAAVEASLRKMPAGWLLGRESFIRAARIVRGWGRGTCGRMDVGNRWRIFADTFNSYLERVTGGSVQAISKNIFGNYNCLDAFFNKCLAAAEAVYPAPGDKQLVETYYKTGVFNIPLNTTQTLARLEAGQGQTHRMLQTAEEMAETRHREIVGKLDALQAIPPGKPRRRGPKPVIPPDCYQTQSLLAAALETSQKNVSQWVRGEGRPPRDFCWPFPIGDKKRLDKCKEEIRRNRESREATAGATKILKKRTRRPKPQAYKEEWGKHNGDPQ